MLKINWFYNKSSFLLCTKKYSYQNTFILINFSDKCKNQKDVNNKMNFKSKSRHSMKIKHNLLSNTQVFTQHCLFTFIIIILQSIQRTRVVLNNIHTLVRTWSPKTFNRQPIHWVEFHLLLKDESDRFNYIYSGAFKLWINLQEG